MLVSNEHFVEVHVRSDPLKIVKIRVKLPIEAVDQLTRCLQENMILFEWTPKKTPDIDPKLAYCNIPFYPTNIIKIKVTKFQHTNRMLHFLLKTKTLDRL